VSWYAWEKVELWRYFYSSLKDFCLCYLQGVTKRCRLSWLTNSALVYEPKCGGGGELRGLSQLVQLYTGAQINFGDLTLYLTYGYPSVTSWKNTNSMYRYNTKSCTNCIAACLITRFIFFFYCLKGVWHEIFDFSLNHESVSPGPLSIPLGSFWLFSKIRRDNREWMFISGVNDTGDKPRHRR